MKIRNSVFSNAAGIFIAAAAAAVITTSSAHAEGNARKGASLAQQWCNSCHTVARTDESRKFDAGPRFVDLAEESETYLRVAIDKPHDFMPNFPKLTAQDKADLVAHIRSLKR